MSDFIRRMRTLENHNGFGDKGKPFAVFFKDDQGILRDRDFQIITYDEHGMYRDPKGDAVEIPHGYAVIVRENVRP
jgi:hypothetical protein